MAKYWRNSGAPFDLPDGRTVPRGYVFKASESSRAVIRRRKKLRPATSKDGPRVADGLPGEGPAEAYPGVVFGSDAAREFARQEGLSAAEIEGTGTRTSEVGPLPLLKGDIERFLDERGG